MWSVFALFLIGTNAQTTNRSLAAFPNPLPAPNEISLSYPPVLGRSYNGNFTTARAGEQQVWGSLGYTLSEGARSAEAAITTDKYPNVTTFSSLSIQTDNGNINFQVQLMLLFFPQTTFNATFVSLSYNTSFREKASLANSSNRSLLLDELARGNYTIDLTGPIYLPRAATLTNRTCQDWVPSSYGCNYRRLTRTTSGRQGSPACGGQLNVPLVSTNDTDSYNYVFPAGYVGMSNNGTLQNMLQPVWGIAISRDIDLERDPAGGQTATWQCVQFRQAQIASNGSLVASAGVSRSTTASMSIVLSFTIILAAVLS